MNYKFGDIFNSTEQYNGHYLVILGVDAKKKKVLYGRITSKVYRAFDGLCSFFNRYCIGRKCVSGNFSKVFSRGKNSGKNIISVNLFNVFFVDKKTYSPTLDKDSMIIINKDLRIRNKSTFDNMIKNDLIKYTSMLSDRDIYRLNTHIRTSEDVSDDRRKIARQSFNIVKKGLK